jgi:cystathionine beta-lyase family protein involved in aluminum resistance
MESFYAAHKNDNQVSAVRVPQFMLSLLSGISPETEALIGDTKDLRYIKFPCTTADKTDFLNTQMNIIAGSKFIEIYRKNDDLKRSVIAVRERKNVVKEILIYNNNA